MKTKDEAQKAGHLLAKEMGPGWKSEVWENLGWHYKVVLGGLQVYPSILDGKVDGYTAFLNSPGEIGGKWAESAKTPEKAIAATFKKAEAMVTEYEHIILAARKLLHQRPKTAIGHLDTLTEAIDAYEVEWGTFDPEGKELLKASKAAAEYVSKK